MPSPIGGWSVRATTAIRQDPDGAEIHNNEGFWERYFYLQLLHVSPGCAFRCENPCENRMIAEVMQ